MTRLGMFSKQFIKKSQLNNKTINFALGFAKFLTLVNKYTEAIMKWKTEICFVFGAFLQIYLCYDFYKIV